MSCMQTAVETQAKTHYDPIRPQPVGKFRGFDIKVHCVKGEIMFTIEGEKTMKPANLVYDRSDKFSLGGFVQRLDNWLQSFEYDVEDIHRRMASDKVELVKALQEKAKPFKEAARLEQMRKDNAEILIELKKMQNDESYVSQWKPSTVLDADDKEAEVDKPVMEAPVSPAPQAVVVEQPAAPAPEPRVTEQPAVPTPIPEAVQQPAQPAVPQQGEEKPALPAQAEKSAERPEVTRTPSAPMTPAVVPLDQPGEAPQKVYDAQTIKNANAAVMQYLKVAQNPAMAKAVLGATFHERLYSGPNGADVTGLVAQRISESPDLAAAILKPEVRGYVAASLVEQAEKVKAIYKESAGMIAQLGFKAQVPNEQSGHYTGKVLAITDHFVIQDIGKQLASLHRRGHVEKGEKIEVGTVMNFTYSGGAVNVAQRGQAASLAVER